MLFGRPDIAATERPLNQLDLTPLGSDGTNGFSFKGDGQNAKLGASVADAGDVNGDGITDLIVGGSGSNTPFGNSYLITGRPENLGTVAQVGNQASSTQGSEWTDVLIGQFGPSTLTSDGGPDVLLGGQGDDTLQLLDSEFVRIDGGRGVDTLELVGDGAELDLTVVPYDDLTSIEQIDLTDEGAQTIKLDWLRVLNLSESGNSLIIDGDTNDRVLVFGLDTDWSGPVAQSIGSEAYQTWTAGNAQIHVGGASVLPITRYEVSANTDDAPIEVQAYRDRTPSGDNYQQAILRAEPIAYYRLNETDGPIVVDSSGNDNHGFVTTGGVGAPQRGLPGPQLPGVDGTAYEFNEEQISLNLDQINTEAGSQNTVAFWMFADDDASKMVFDFGDYYGLYLRGSNGWNDFGFNTGNGDIFGVSFEEHRNRWIHVTAIFNNGGRDDVLQNRLFIDGVEQTLTSRRRPPLNGQSTATTDAYISGARHGGDRFQSGLVDELAVFNRALRPTEIREFFAASRRDFAGPADTLVIDTAEFNTASEANTQEPLNYAQAVQELNPIAYYRLTDNDGQTVHDSSGNEQHGMVVDGDASAMIRDAQGPQLPGIEGTAWEYQSEKVQLDLTGVNVGDGESNTVSFWMYRATDGAGAPFAFNRWNLDFKAGAFGFNTSGTDVFGVDYTNHFDRWVHVTAIFENSSSGGTALGRSRLFLDGVEQQLDFVDSSTVHPQYAYPDAEAYISGWGRDDSIARLRNTRIDEFSAFDRALTPGEIRGLFHAARREQVGSAEPTFVTPPSYSGTIVSQEPIAYYRLNDQESSVVTESLGIQPDGLQVTAANRIVVGPQIDHLNSAREFDGSQAIKLSATGVSSFDGAETTVAFWMNWNGSFVGGPIPFSFYDANTGVPYDLILSSPEPLANRSFGFNTGNGDNFGINLDELDAELANRWVHVTAIFHNGDVTKSRLFIDGRELTLQNLDPSRSPQNARATAEAYIAGWGASGGNRFSGQLDEFAIFNRALTAEEVAAQYASSGYPAFAAQDNSTARPVIGWVFEDANGNGSPNPGEVLEGIEVFLDRNLDGIYQPGEPATVTDAHGRYELPEADFPGASIVVPISRRDLIDRSKYFVESLPATETAAGLRRQDFGLTTIVDLGTDLGSPSRCTRSIPRPVKQPRSFWSHRSNCRTQAVLVPTFMSGTWMVFVTTRRMVRRLRSSRLRMGFTK